MKTKLVIAATVLSLFSFASAAKVSKEQRKEIYKACKAQAKAEGVPPGSAQSKPYIRACIKQKTKE